MPNPKQDRDAKWNEETQSGTYSDKIHWGEMKINKPTMSKQTPLQAILEKYKRFRDNVKWHIDVNKPTGEELKGCLVRHTDFVDIVKDLELLAVAEQQLISDAFDAGVEWENAQQLPYVKEVMNKTEFLNQYKD